MESHITTTDKNSVLFHDFGWALWEFRCTSPEKFWNVTMLLGNLILSVCWQNCIPQFQRSWDAVQNINGSECNHPFMTYTQRKLYNNNISIYLHYFKIFANDYILFIITLNTAFLLILETGLRMGCRRIDFIILTEYDEREWAAYLTQIQKKKCGILLPHLVILFWKDTQGSVFGYPSSSLTVTKTVFVQIMFCDLWWLQKISKEINSGSS